ncbi:MAG: hypothetical protein F4Y02_06040 [Chloroflexi bacterium]|nr:hypothetical protein [Chloroflexota bacterium]
MFFAAEDELAVHTIASAAYRLISDLKSKHGYDEAGDHYLTMVFFAVRDYRRGTLPKVLADDPDAVRWIKSLADRLPITSSSEYRDFRASVSSAVRDAFRSNRNKVANFLKHADRDADLVLPSGDVDNLTLLMTGLGSYLDVAPDDLGPEGRVLWIYFCVANTLSDNLPAEYAPVADALKEASPDDQLRLCRELIVRLGVSDSGKSAALDR